MVINFFGKRGSGKTTAIRGQLKDCRAPVVIIDVLGNYNKPEYFQTESLPVCIRKIKEIYNKTKDMEPNTIPVQMKVVNLRTSNPTLAADYISACIWEINGGTMVLDEVDSIKIYEGSCFDEYIRYGRNHNGDLITGCRRPAELDRNITAAANKFFCFSTHEWRDIEYFRDSVFGDRALELQKMERFTGLFIDHDNEITGKFRIDIMGNIYYTEVVSINADHNSA